MATSAVSFLATAMVVVAILQAAVSSPPPSPPEMGRPTTCSSTLLPLYNCKDFLSAATGLGGAPDSCCSSLRALLGTPASICLCHVYGGEINTVLNINIDPVRLALLPLVCLAFIPPQLPYMCLVGPVPPIHEEPRPPAAAANRS